MMLRRAAISAVLIATMALATTACIADTKFPPAATTEYFPCTSMDLTGPRVQPEPLLGSSPLWAGFWNTGEEWHIGVTDPGGVDWNVQCAEINDPDLVVHEAPHTWTDLVEWEETLEDRFDAEPEPDRFAVELTVVNGQYVLDIAGPRLEDVTALTVGIPFDAWIYRGTLR